MNPLLQTRKVEARMSVGVNDVANYLTANLDADEVLGRLRTGGQPGQLLSGEVCLQEAAYDQGNADFWLDKSVTYFGQAWRLEDTRTITPRTPTATRAALRLAQMPVLKPMLLDSEFASAGAVEQAYRDTTMIAAHVGSLILKPNAFRHTKIKNDCFGIFSEVAVLGLAQRFSVQNSLTDCWQASRSLIGADRGTVRRGVVKDGWDMDVWSKEDAQLPELSYRVQIKSSDHIVKSYRPGIQVVNVAPDLAVTDNEQALLGLRIVQELNRDQPGANRYKRLSKTLSQRTEQLLNALER